jgi:hypothetical protein
MVRELAGIAGGKRFCKSVISDRNCSRSSRLQIVGNGIEPEVR